MGGHVFLEFPEREDWKFIGNYPEKQSDNESHNIKSSTFSIAFNCYSNKVTTARKIIKNIDWTFTKNCVYTAVEGMKEMGFKHADKINFPVFGILPTPKELNKQMLKFYKKDKEGLTLYVHKEPSLLKKFLEPAYKDAARYDKAGISQPLSVNDPIDLDYGGISLSKRAQMQLNILDITGAIFDTTSGQIILFGKEKQKILPKVNIDDLAVAIKSIYGIGINHPQTPGVSIGTEPSDKSGQMKIRYDGASENTSFGKIMFEADRLLKCLTLGKDNLTGKPFRSNIPGFLSLHDRLGKNFEGHLENRMWFVPEKISLIQSEDGKSIIFDEVKMNVLTEAQMNKTFLDYTPCKNFAKHIRDHYDEYAREFPILEDLKDLGKITAVVKWLKDNKIPFDTSFFMNYKPKYVKTLKYTPESKRVTEWKTYDVKNSRIYTHKHHLTTTGGVIYRLDQKNFNLQKDFLVDNFSSAILQARPKETDFKWSFYSPINYEKFSAVACSLYKTKKPGNIKRFYLDISLKVDKDINLNLYRFYNSFSEDTSYLGYGWKILPYEIKLPLKKIELQDQRIKTYSHIFLRIFDTENFYELVGLNRENLPIFKSKTNKFYIKDNLNNTFSLHLSNDDLMAVFDKLGRLLKTKHEDVFAIYEYNSDKLVKIYAMKGKASTGKNISFQYEKNKMIKAMSSDGKIVKFSYNTQGLLGKVTNACGENILYFYDRDKRLNKISDEKNIIFSAVYDDYNRATKIHENGNEYNFEYSLEKRIMKTTNDVGEESVIKFDEKNRIIQKKEGIENFEYFYNDESSLLPTKIVDTNGHIIELRYNNNGQITFFKNPLGAIWNFTYDKKGNLLIQKEPNGRNITYAYDSKNNIKSVSLNAKVTFSKNGTNFNSTCNARSMLFYNYDSKTNNLTSINT